MDALRATVMWVAVIGLTAVLTQQAAAGGLCCQSCGCHEHVKRVCKLVCTYEEVETPTYACSPLEVFCPDKGKVCSKCYRCDTIYKLHTHCNSTTCETCTECGCCRCEESRHCLTTCTCKTVSGCKKLCGAKPTGCFHEQCVKQPTGVCKQRVPVIKWVTFEVCDDCCRSGK